MKRFAIALLILALVLGAAACKVAPAAAPTPTLSAETVSPKPPAEPTATPTEQPAVTAAPAEQPEASAEKDFSQIGSDLMKAESIGTAKIGMTESELLAAIGQPESESEAQVWGSDGKKHSDWIYRSAGLTVNMSEGSNAESEFVVYSIKAEAPFAQATQKGVKIGDTKDTVLAAYGYAVEAEDGSGDSIVAGTVYGGLIFEMKDGKVASVFLGAAAE